VEEWHFSAAPAAQVNPGFFKPQSHAKGHGLGIVRQLTPSAIKAQHYPLPP